MRHPIPPLALLLLLLLPAAALPGQTMTLVVPPGLDRVEGNSSHWMVGQYPVCRAQQIYASTVFGSLGGMAIRSFRMRRDGNLAGSCQAHSCSMEVTMSNRAVDPPTGYSLGWAGNHGADLALAMARRTILWGAEPQPVVAPAPFTVLFPLDKPFAWTGGALVIEWISDHAAGSGPYAVAWETDAERDFTWYGDFQPGPVREIGRGCPMDFVSFAETPIPGGPWHHFGYCGVPNQATPCFMLFGYNDKQLGGIPLPFDLVNLGGPGCRLYIGALHAATTTADPTSPTGRCDFRLGLIPNEPSLSGSRYYVQMVAYDPGYNRLGLRFSPGREYTIGTGFSGTTQGFCFYGYKDSAASTWQTANPAAIYYSPRANVVEFTY